MRPPIRDAYHKQQIMGITRYISGLWLAAALLTGCAKDHTIDPVRGGGAAPKGRAYLALRIEIDGMDGAATRATEEGHEGESRINHLRAILYDNSGDAVIVMDYTIDAEGTPVTPLNGGAGVYYTDPFLVDDQDYRLVVLANHHDNFDTGSLLGATERSFDFFELTGIGSPAPTTDDVADYGNFFMSNADGPVRVTMTMLNTDPAEAALDPVQVNIERAVAKVTVDKDDVLLAESLAANGYESWDEQDVYGIEFDYIGDPSQGAMIAEMKWGIDRMAREFYPLRQSTYTAPYNTPGANGKGPVESAFTERTDYYAKDPTFDNLSLERQGEEEDGSLWAYFDLLEYLTPVELDYAIGSNWGDSRYLAENTMETEEQWADVTTRVVVRLRYSGFNENYSRAADDKPQAFSSFFSYKGLAISPWQLGMFIYNQESIIYDPYTNLWRLRAELGECLKPFLSGNVYYDNQILNERFLAAATYYGFAPDLINTYNDPDYYTYVYPGEAFTEPDESMENFMGIEGLDFHKDGWCWYSVPIRHFNDTQSPEHMGYGRYGVVRNNHYRLTVTSISGPGYALPPPPEGSDDKEEEQSFISVRATLLPWTVREQNATLGNPAAPPPENIVLR